MFPTLTFDTIAINTSALLIFFSVWVGMTRAEAYAQKAGFASASIINLCTLITAGGLVGARLGFVLRYLNAFLANPVSLFSPNPLMLDLSGGILGAALAGAVYIQRKKMPFLKSLDAIAPFLLTVSIGLAFSNLASGNAYGAPTSMPWGLPLWGAARHPTQVFEILLAAASAFLLWPENPWVKIGFLEADGVRFVSVFAFAAFSRLLIEPFRGDSAAVLGSFHLPQLVAFAVLILSLGLAAYLLRAQPAGAPTAEKE